jgi:TATA-binding protein-associated factor Taf7
VEVKTGITEAMWVEIKEGLEEDDLIVTGPIKTLMSLTDNQKIIWEEEKAEDSEEGKDLEADEEEIEEKRAKEEEKPAEEKRNVEDN